MDIAAGHYDIGTAGEMHHDPSRNVLYVAESVEAIARRTRRDTSDVRRILDSAQRQTAGRPRATADAFR